MSHYYLVEKVVQRKETDKKLQNKKENMSLLGADFDPVQLTLRVESHVAGEGQVIYDKVIAHKYVKVV